MVLRGGKVFTNSHVHSILKKKNIRDERMNQQFDKEVSFEYFFRTILQ